MGPHWEKSFLLILCMICALSVTGQQGLAQQRSENKHRENLFFFGSVGAEEPVEHTFSFQNTTQEPLEIENVQMQPPLVATKMTSRVPPGGTGSLTVKLGTPREFGEFKSPVVLNFRSGAPEKVFWMVGKVVRPIEFDPIKSFYVATERGKSKTMTLEIINHRKDPLDILRVEGSSPRFTTHLETVKPGREYRLSLTLNGEGAAGRETDTLMLVTDSPDEPYIEIPTHTYVKERVYAFPDEIDFGAIQTKALKYRPAMLSFLDQSFMVYQIGGKHFEISVSTDVPFLQLKAVPSRMGDRFQINVSVVPEKLKAGKIDGSIAIQTNDSEFPRLVVPVKGSVDEDW